MWVPGYRNGRSYCTAVRGLRCRSMQGEQRTTGNCGTRAEGGGRGKDRMAGRSMSVWVCGMVTPLPRAHANTYGGSSHL